MRASARRLTIGQAAKHTGLSQKAIRLYEARGLLPATARTEAGYRTFSQRDLGVLHFIRRARSLGLRLEEIKQVIELERGGAQPCVQVLRLVGAHIREIDRTIAELRTLRSALVEVQEAAVASDQRGEDAVVCQVIERQPAPGAVGPRSATPE